MTTSAITPLSVCASEAAKLLGISVRHLWSLADAGKIPRYRAGRRVLFAVADLQAYLASIREQRQTQE